MSGILQVILILILAVQSGMAEAELGREEEVEKHIQRAAVMIIRQIMTETVQRKNSDGSGTVSGTGMKTARKSWWIIWSRGGVS